MALFLSASVRAWSLVALGQYVCVIRGFRDPPCPPGRALGGEILLPYPPEHRLGRGGTGLHMPGLARLRAFGHLLTWGPVLAHKHPDVAGQCTDGIGLVRDALAPDGEVSALEPVEVLRQGY